MNPIQTRHTERFEFSFILKLPDLRVNSLELGPAEWQPPAEFVAREGVRSEASREAASLSMSTFPGSALRGSIQ